MVEVAAPEVAMASTLVGGSAVQDPTVVERDEVAGFKRIRHLIGRVACESGEPPERRVRPRHVARVHIRKGSNRVERTERDRAPRCSEIDDRPRPAMVDGLASVEEHPSERCERIEVRWLVLLEVAGYR